MDDLKCPPLALWASSAEKSFLISRLERPHLRSNESPSGAFKRQSGLRKQMEGRCPDKLCGALQTLFHERSCDLSCENGRTERPQAFRSTEIQSNISLNYAQINAEGISNHFLCKKPAGHRCTAGFGLQFTLPWSRALPQQRLPALLRGQQRERRASPRASGDWGHPSAGRG